MDEPLLNICNLNVNYNKTSVLKDISFKVGKSEILGIVGESGSGKSTLIKAAMGLLGNNAYIKSGNIFYKGKDIINMPKEELRKIRGPEMGMIFQNCQNTLCPVRTIEEQLYESLSQHKKVTKAEVGKLALEMLERFKFSNAKRVLKSYPFELSGGMNQRVGIMMAMLLNPSLIFADEPTSALDVTVQKRVVDEMICFSKDFNVSIVIVTHNIGVVEYMADNIAVMFNGEMVEYGEKEKVINNPENEYTKNLLKAVIRIKGR